MKRTFNPLAILASISLLFLLNCTKEKVPVATISPTDIDQTVGFGLLNKVKGIWNGPLSSTTALGSFPQWIVDFRPISENQISAKNELDTLNDIFMSFFVAKYKNEYRLAFRNGGSFNGSKRVSYFLCDSVSEKGNSSYYRFSEIIIGKKRAYTEVIFSADSLYLKSFTNYYNTQPSSIPHMVWSAKRQDLTSCQTAVQLFNYPKKTLTKDFSTTFEGQTESIYYSTNSVPTGDPYPELDHPYLGEVTIQTTFASAYNPNPAKKVLLMITTQPLINGFSIDFTQLATRSRYVILSSTDNSFTFNYMHPGTYYVYSLYDTDANLSFSSGDWVSTANTTFNLSDNGSALATTLINFTLP